MRKLLILFMAVFLVSAGAVVATADVELGFSQNMADTYYRLDVQNFFFELPVEGQITHFNLGGQLDTTFYDLYGLGAVKFVDDSGEFYPKELGLGLGYPITFGPIKVFAEMRVSSPQWIDVNTWSAEPFVGFEFKFSAFDEGEPV